MAPANQHEEAVPFVTSSLPDFLSRRDVARLFGVSTSTVTRWAQRGLLKTVKTPGGHYRFPAEETRRTAARSGLADLVRLD